MNLESGATPSAIQPLRSEEARGVRGPSILQMRKQAHAQSSLGYLAHAEPSWPSMACVSVDSLSAPATHTHTYMLVPYVVGEGLQKSEGLGRKAEMQSQHRSPGFDVPQTHTHALKHAQTSFCTCWLGIR